MSPKEFAGPPVETHKVAESASMSVGVGASSPVEPPAATRPAAPEGGRVVSRYVPQTRLNVDSAKGNNAGSGVEKPKEPEEAPTATSARRVVLASKTEGQIPAPKPVKLDRDSPEYEVWHQWGKVLREELEAAHPDTDRLQLHFTWIGLMQKEADRRGLGITIMD